MLHFPDPLLVGDALPWAQVADEERIRTDVLVMTHVRSVCVMGEGGKLLTCSGGLEKLVIISSSMSANPVIRCPVHMD